jgi:hypothetical protein
MHPVFSNRKDRTDQVGSYVITQPDRTIEVDLLAQFREFLPRLSVVRTRRRLDFDRFQERVELLGRRATGLRSSVFSLGSELFVSSLPRRT